MKHKTPRSGRAERPCIVHAKPEDSSDSPRNPAGPLLLCDDADVLIDRVDRLGVGATTVQAGVKRHPTTRARVKRKKKRVSLLPLRSNRKGRNRLLSSGYAAYHVTSHVSTTFSAQRSLVLIEQV
eukprot:238380-Rhodomonas_salina.1